MDLEMLAFFKMKSSVPHHVL